MSADEAPDTSYYQWVTFMFCIQVEYFMSDISSVNSEYYLGSPVLSALQNMVCPGEWGHCKFWHRRSYSSNDQRRCQV